MPRTEQKAAEQALAKKGSKAWLSDDAKGRSVNLQGRKGSLKQNSFGALKLFWAPLLTRGKLRVVPLSKDFPGGTAEGVATLATKLLPALKKRFLGSPLPKVVFADRGLGSFHPNGAITAEWQAGLKATTPASPETETEADYYARLQEGCADVNKRHDVEGLCKGFRARLGKVVEKEGDAIGK